MYIQSTISANDAFIAMQSNKHVVCRKNSDVEFSELSGFPATVFFDNTYEFALSVDTVNYEGISFVKPYSLDELEAGQQIYLVGNTGVICVGGFVPDYEELEQAVRSGFVQRDPKSAIDQLKAIHALLGVEIDIQIKKVEFAALMAAEQKRKQAGAVGEPQPLKLGLDDDIHEKLKDLTDRAAEATTPAEANALVRYTNTWTEDQRKPLLTAINKRLIELSEQSDQKSAEEPSLMVRIQNAKTLDDLGKLKPEVDALDDTIKGKMMDIFLQREFDLNCGLKQE